MYSFYWLMNMNPILGSLAMVGIVPSSNPSPSRNMGKNVSGVRIHVIPRWKSQSWLGAPKRYKLVYKPHLTMVITTINHSEVVVMFTN